MSKLVSAMPAFTLPCCTLHTNSYRYRCNAHGLWVIPCTDPDEQHDLASVNTSVARQLDGLLRSQFDYTEVDLKVKTNDKMIYQKFFVEPAAGNETVLRAHWEKAYRGFDDADWAKAKAWAAEPLPPLKGL